MLCGDRCGIDSFRFFILCSFPFLFLFSLCFQCSFIFLLISLLMFFNFTHNTIVRMTICREDPPNYNILPGSIGFRCFLLFFSATNWIKHLLGRVFFPSPSLFFLLSLGLSFPSCPFALPTFLPSHPSFLLHATPRLPVLHARRTSFHSLAPSFVLCSSFLLPFPRFLFLFFVLLFVFLFIFVFKCVCNSRFGGCVYV